MTKCLREIPFGLTLIKFSKRETIETISRCCSYYALALHFQRERDQEHFGCALSSISVFPITHPPLGGNIGHTRQHPSRRVHTSNSFPPFLRNWTEATPGSRSVRTNFSVFKHARMGPIRCAGPESQHFRWEKMRVFPSQYPTARSLRSARKEREATPWVDSSGE